MGAKKNMLVGIAFSEQSQLMLDEACVFAKAAGAEITLLYVIPPGRFFDKSTSAEEIIQINDKLNKLAEDTRKATGLVINTKTIEGKVYGKIIDVSNELDVDLIFMGTNQVSGIKGSMGSNAIKVVRDTARPVITINSKVKPHNCDVIVVPLDLSKGTKEKIAYAIEYAHYFNATLKLMTVLKSDDANAVNRLMRQIASVKGIVEEKKINCTAEVVKSSSSSEKFSDSILNYAKDNDADLIMIMTQQENEISEFFVGSAAQEIMNNSEIPVMSIVPSP